jgi:hypothetical protein
MKKLIATLGALLLEILILSGIVRVNVQLVGSDFTFFNVFLFISLFIFGIISIGFCIIIITLVLDYD